jgi:hypothetical protein
MLQIGDKGTDVVRDRFSRLKIVAAAKARAG